MEKVKGSVIYLKTLPGHPTVEIQMYKDQGQNQNTATVWLVTDDKDFRVTLDGQSTTIVDVLAVSLSKMMSVETWLREDRYEAATTADFFTEEKRS